MQVIVRLRPGMILTAFDEKGNAEIIEFDNARDEQGELIVTGHVIISNPSGSDGIYDEVMAYLKGEPGRLQPIEAVSGYNDNVVAFPTREIRDVA